MINYSVNKLIGLKLWKNMEEMLGNCKSELNWDQLLVVSFYRRRIRESWPKHFE